MLGFDVQKRDPWDSGSTSYYEVSGVNLDIQTGDRLAKGFKDNAYTSDTSNKWGPNAQVERRIRRARQMWEITAGYGAISYTGNIIDFDLHDERNDRRAQQRPRGRGAGRPTVRCTRAATTAFTTTTLSPADSGSSRSARGATPSRSAANTLLDDWTFASKVQHEHKEGTLEESLRETYGGRPSRMPVDYDTDRFDVSATYSDPDFQAVIEYTYSRFTDNNIGVTLPYPVSISALSATSGPYAQSGLYSTPPGNAAHYVTIMMADKLSPKTRITFNGRVGVELQDSIFPANSADPNSRSTLGNPDL